MFARVLTLQVRLEKRQELNGKALAEIIPVIKRSSGAVQVVILQDDIQLDKLIIISLWRSREDIDRYMAANYQNVLTALKPYVTFPPTTSLYRVNNEIPCFSCTVSPDNLMLSEQSDMESESDGSSAA